MPLARALRPTPETRALEDRRSSGREWYQSPTIDMPESSADLISVNCFVVDGRVHAHRTMADEHGAFGGHLDPETTAFTFALIALGVLNDDMDLSRAQDKDHR